MRSRRAGFAALAPAGGLRAAAGSTAGGGRCPPDRRAAQWRLLVPALARLIVLVLIIGRELGDPSGSFPCPSRSSLAGMSVGQRIVSIARSQLGYTTDPSSSYCNKFSAYWGVGSQSCPGAESSEEWCADFAAWAWRQAGVPFSYGFNAGEINAAAASFYSWGVDHGTWHSASSGYRARPGDVAVYGLSLGDVGLGRARRDRDRRPRRPARTRCDQRRR